jgi:hypothetical protein
MRKPILISIVLFLLCATATAQLQGPLSGTLGPGTYTVVGDISVETGSSLVIEPGTVFLFTGDYCFEICGYLNAVGNETDSIKFMPDAVGRTWSGLDYDNADEACTLGFCFITGSNSSGLYIYQSSPTISGCTISGNSTSWGGGGISIGYWDSGPTISNCIITGNYAGYGGGIMICGTPTTIINCTISDNWARYGAGGIDVDQCGPTIHGCTVTGNSASYGGGIFASKASPTISYCTVTDNLARDGDGGGLVISKCSSAISNCTVSGNSAEENGGGMLIDMCVPTIVNTIVEGNSGNGGIFFSYYPDADISYSDFYENEGGDFAGDVPPDLGDIVTVNANEDSCDIFYNIFEDPLFEDPAGGNFQITWANFPVPDSTMSPCIDAGDPDSPFDPDYSIADIGAYYFHQEGCSMLQITLNPLGMPIVIPLQGGAFAFDVSVTNYDIESHTAEVWFTIEVPGGYQFTVFGPDEFTFAPGLMTSHMLFQFVPENAPAGEYTFYAFLGEYPLNVMSCDSFPFMKEGESGDWINSKSWTLTGDLFEHMQEISEVTPTELTLLRAFPNPFNLTTALSFTLPEASRVHLAVYDVSGRLVSDLLNGWRDAGAHEIAFDASNLASGLYLYRLIAGDFNVSGKMLLLK